MKKSVLLVVILLIGSLNLTNNLYSQTSIFNPRLKHGKYSVGFKIINQYDYERRYNPENESGDNPRPVQTLIWYPANMGNNPKYMLYEDYIYLDANIEKFVQITDKEKQKVKESLIRKKAFPENLMRELPVKTKSIKNAKPVKGSFPIVIYSPSWNSSSWENSDLCEYLASHGYIVVSSPSFGKYKWKMTSDMDGLGAQADDIVFLVKSMKGYPNSDYSKIGIVGYSWGGFANIIAAQKLNNISAVLSIDGAISIFFNKFSALTPYISPSKMDIPYMFISLKPTTAEELIKLNRDTTFTFYKSLNKADSYLATLYKMEHVDFRGSYMKLETNYSEMKENIKKEKLFSYELMCEYTLNFLNAYVKKENNSKNWLIETPLQKNIPNEILKVEYKLK